MSSRHSAFFTPTTQARFSRSRKATRVTSAGVLLAALIGFAAIDGPSIAKADTIIPASPAEARAQGKKSFDQGALEYTQGNYEAAVAAWQKAYDLSQEPLIFENIGNAYERLGKPREARDALVKWRAVAPPEEHAILDRRIQNLNGRIAREDAELAKKKQQDDALKQQAAQNGNSGDGLPFSLPGVIVGGAGVLAVIAGVVVDGVAASKRPDKATVCKKSGSSELCLASAKDDISTSNTMAIAGDVTWIVGAAAIAAGGVLLLTYKQPTSSPLAPQPPKTGRVDVLPFAGPQGGGVVMRGAW